MINPTKKKSHFTYTLVDIYRLYARERKNDSAKLDERTWKRVAMRLLYLISVAMIRENYIFRAPYQVGIFGVLKSKNKKRHLPDYRRSEELGKPVRHLNRHSNWCYFFFKWEKARLKRSAFLNHSLYSFEPVRDERRREIGKRGLAQWIKTLYADPYSKDYDALTKLI